MNKSYTIKEIYSGMRIDRWIRNNVASLPQSLIEKSLRKGKIKVNIKKVNSSYKLKTGDKMLGFSLPKILLLIFIIFIIWYGFKMIERRASGKVESSKNKKSTETDTSEDVKDSKKKYTDAEYTEIDEDNEK